MAGRSHTIPLLYRLARPKNAVPPLLAVLLGYTAAGGQTFSETTLLTSLFGVLCLNFAATLQNDLADKTIDASAKRRTPLLDGQVANEQVHLVGVGLSMLSLAVPALFGQTVVFVSLLVYLILCWFYNQPPIQASRRPISSIALLALLFHTLPLLLGVYAAGGEGDYVVLAALAIGGFVQRFALSILKDYKDYEADWQHNKRTFLVAFGALTTNRVSLLASAFGYASILTALIIAPVPVWAVIILAPIAIYSTSLRRSLRTEQKSFPRNNKLFHLALDVNNLFDAGVILCFYTW